MTQAELERVGEYVLGLLEGPEAEAFERQLAQSPELSAAVDKFRRHLHALDVGALVFARGRLACHLPLLADRRLAAQARQVGAPEDVVAPLPRPPRR
ncbi:MAG: hypothetical protein EOP20_09615, partial [Hyphomicrobiales bacterium]